MSVSHQEYDKDEKIIPDQQDFEQIEKECGRLPEGASDEEAAERYRLAQANKIIRLFATAALK
jgi:hypothetical protein